MDYVAWLSRVKAFTDALKTCKGCEVLCDMAPPLGVEAFKNLQHELRLAVPRAVKDFLLQGSASCFFKYSLPIGTNTALPGSLDFLNETLDGGGLLCPAHKLADYLSDAHAWATDTWIADYPEDQSFWLNSLPILEVGNGDYLAVRADKEQDDPPVVYLSHEDESRVVAPSFTTFLQVWEALCYIHPDLALLDPFIDADTGYLFSRSEVADALRTLFHFE